MQKFVLIVFIFIFTVSQTFAYAIKVYDENGNKIGTYKKENNCYQFYDLKGKKAQKPSVPVRYYPLENDFYPSDFFDNNIPYVARPNPNADSNISKYADYHEDMNYVDTKYAKFHKFK